jgi:hypothetical protein
MLNNSCCWLLVVGCLSGSTYIHGIDANKRSKITKNAPTNNRMSEDTIERSYQQQKTNN